MRHQTAAKIDQDTEARTRFPKARVPTAPEGACQVETDGTRPLHEAPALHLLAARMRRWKVINAWGRMALWFAQVRSASTLARRI